MRRNTPQADPGVRSVNPARYGNLETSWRRFPEVCLPLWVVKLEELGLRV